jgi:hypothetical protein
VAVVKSSGVCSGGGPKEGRLLANSGSSSGSGDGGGVTEVMVVEGSFLPSFLPLSLPAFHPPPPSWSPFLHWRKRTPTSQN